MDDGHQGRGDPRRSPHRAPSARHRRGADAPRPASSAARAAPGTPDLVVVIGDAGGTSDAPLLAAALGNRLPVREARSGREATDLLATLRPRRPVVVTALDGHRGDAAAAVRRLVEELAPAPVVALVDQGDAAAVAAAVEGGARDYVARHFSPHQVERVLALAGGGSRGRDQLRRADRLWRAVVSRTSDAVFLVTPSGGFRVLTPAAAQLFAGHDVPAGVDEVLALVHPSDRAALEATYAAWLGGSTDPVVLRRSVPGGWRSYEVVGVDLRSDPAVAGVVVTIRDVTEAVAARSRALYMAGTDPLTGLPARRHFTDTVSAAAASGAPVLILLDVDGMTAVNERLGREAGDELLRAVAERLTRDLPPTDTVSRVGGDEFAVLVADPPPGTSAEELARAVVASLSAAPGAPTAGSAPAWAPVAAGVAVGGGVEGAQLLVNAEQALAIARRRGPNSVVRFDSALAARTTERRRLRADLRWAAARGELELHYQPVRRLPDEALVGFEALVRWRHPELGLLAPDRFVGLGEQSGAIVDVDAWVLRQACTQLAAWSRRRPDLPIGMAVNVSARQLVDPGFAASVAEVLGAVDVVPSRLCMEVTERAVVDDLDAAAAALRTVRTTGVRIAIDDFGIGFSSLAYLQRFPADHIKVDRSFVAGIGTDPVDTTLVDTIMVMADRLGIAVVAEGVETAGQRAELLRMGCPFAQGFLWSRPLHAEDATALVDGVPPATRWESPWVPPPAEPRPTTGWPSPAPAPSGSGGRRGDRADAAADFLGHELRTPIHVIGSYAELLRMQLRDAGGPVAGAEAAVDAIDRQVSHLKHLVGSLRDARAVDEGTLVLHRRRVDVGALARALSADLAGELAEHALRVTVAADAPPVPADPGRLTQILTNLLVNAAKFSPAGTVVDVGVRPAPGGVEVTVVDRGPGIPLSAAADVFRRFVSLDPRRRGSGLGLFLARGIAQAHGGELTYRRASTGGAEFCLFLPAEADGGAGGGPAAGGPARRPTGEPSSAGPSDAAARSTGDGGRDLAVPLVAPLPPPVDRDAEALRVLAAAQQAMAAAGDRAGLSAVLDRVVAELGGRVVGASHPAPDEVVPVDLSLGRRPARFAAAEVLSAVRVRLDALLPVLADFARSLAARLPS